ncbi:zinc metalloproteinase-like protein [Wolffia australiana]
MEGQNTITLCAIWRDKRMELDLEENISVRELGQKLQNLTKVKADTMRLLFPQPSGRGFKLLIPFSEEHSNISLKEISIPKGKPIRMLGVFEHEIEEISQSRSKSDSRIRGFEEEEERLRHRLLTAAQPSLKLPQGPYIFCEFRTLTVPGMELTPPPSEALKRMHMLACDPGIIAIMNKHRWRVGIMSEMAPVGYVGISPSCLLGLNKNQGKEISLRLRTDDLKGFRKYEIIKKTLLHELAHMVHSDHNADFYALDKQLNEEAVSLDWTRSRGRTLTGRAQTETFGDMASSAAVNSGPHKLGGGLVNGSNTDPRSTSAAAAIRRHLSTVNGLDRVGPEPDLDSTQLLTNLRPVEEFGPVNEPITNSSLRSTSTSLANGVDQAKLNTDRAELNIDRSELNMDRAEENTDRSEPDSDRVEPDSEPGVSPLTIESELVQGDGPAIVAHRRINDAIELLRRQASPAEAASSLHTLLKIVRNIIDNPGESKFRRLRKANPVIQRHVVSRPGAMEVLAVMGFYEDADAVLVMKRNDPGLLWLAKSSLEVIVPSTEGTF